MANQGAYPPFTRDTNGNILVKITNAGALQTPWLSNINAAGFLLNNLGTPVASTDAATKAYVDAFVSGLFPLTACVVASTTALTVTYANGTAGVGATLTNAGALVAFSLDGVSPSINQRVLIKDQASGLQNGIYTLTTVGSGAVAWVLTRATDFDTAAEILEGSYTNITSGTANSGSVWLFTTSSPVVVGTTALTFSSFGAFGTMAAQNANAVVITGGTINGTVIGGSTPAAATFTTAAATTFTGALAGNASTSTSTVAVQSVNEATDTTCFPLFISASGTQTLPALNNTGLTYNSNTNNLGCTTFTGALVGNASTSTSSTNATNTTNTAITDDTSTNATTYPTWVTANTGNLPQKVTSTKLSFNPSTGVITATGFAGALTGNVTGNVSGTAATVTGATQSAITQCGTFVTGQLVKSGTGTATGGIQTTINVNTTPASNTTTGETDLMSYTIPANSLSAVGKTVRVTCWGNEANNVNAKTVQTYIGGTSINSATLLTSALGVWKTVTLFVCTGSNTQSYFSETIRLNVSAQDISARVQGTLAKTDTSDIIFKTTGTGGATSDITQTGMIVEFLN